MYQRQRTENLANIGAPLATHGGRMKRTRRRQGQVLPRVTPAESRSMSNKELGHKTVRQDLQGAPNGAPDLDEVHRCR